MRPRYKIRWGRARVLTYLIAVAAIVTAALQGTSQPKAQAAGDDDVAKSLALFNESLKVFRHPRCLNCHPGGDNPTQGMDMHAHTMNVQRGPDNHGAIALNCATCHGTENNLNSLVPGAPKWGLAPKNLAWQNLSDHDLCELFKNPQKMEMTPEQFVKHNAEDPLVGWGWRPGGNREPVPGTQKEFGQLIAQWVATGAHCPP